MRPRFHFTATSGWINDPHGITVRHGEYHAFYQYVPNSTVWAPNCHWGHAKGKDLFSLAELPVAIAPGEGDEGIWTGTLVTDDAGRTRIFYTSTAQPNIGIGRIRVATPVDDEWIEWSKGDFVADVPEALNIIAYRDPFLVKEPDIWRMFLGAGNSEGQAMALSYTSPDLAVWTYEGVALERSTNEREPVWMGALWECPQIIEVDGRAVMVSSVWDNDVLHYAGYAVGTYSDGKFKAESWGRLTFGPSYYAPSFFRDADGRPCLTFWMRGVSDMLEGWASAHSVPHVLTLDGDQLVAAPHPDLEKYRSSLVDSALSGLAGDVVWSPGGGDELVVMSAGQTVLSASEEGDDLRITTALGEWNLPWSSGPVRIVLDAQAVEISTIGGVFGIAVTVPGETYTVSSSTGSVQAWELER